MAEPTDAELLDALRGLSAEMRKVREVSSEMASQQTELFVALRDRGVMNRVIGEAAGISDAAVIQRVRKALEA